MRIGIDAKWYFGGPPSGIRVIQNLVNSLIEFNEESEFYIFLDSKYKKLEFIHSKNNRVKCIYIWAGNNLLSNVFVLPLIANRYNLDILVFQNFVSPLYTGKKVAYIFDVLFMSFPQFFTKRERLYFFFIKYLVCFADKIITLSNEEKKRLVKFGFASENKVEAIYLGIDDSFKILQNHSKAVVAHVKSKYDLPDRFILYVGRLNTRKNIENLIKALPLINERNIPLIIVGKEDWKHANYKELVDQVGIRNRIIFTGWTEESELPIIYALATIFCFPSYAEGFGLPPLEAMASGVPVISSNTTCLPEICGEAALYVSPENPSELVLAINQLLEKKELYEEMTKKGILHTKEFSWEKTAVKFYNTLLATVNNS